MADLSRRYFLIKTKSQLNIRIEVGSIKKPNNEAFWLGAEVGETESVTHIPTQITNYKGINAPLANWEYSFFKGYLLRCVSGKVNQVRIYSYHRYANAKIGSEYTRTYIQNAKGVDYYCYYLILNSDKQKIDENGNVLSDDDRRAFRQVSYFNLPSGNYYYREIRSYISKMITEDIPFTVVDSDTEQTIYIDHEVNFLRMYYTCDYSTRPVFEGDATPYLDTTEQTFSRYYYKESNSLSFNYRYTTPIMAHFEYKINSILLNDKDLTNQFSFEWEDGSLTASGIEGTINISEIGVTSVRLGGISGNILNEDGHVIAHRQYLYATSGFDDNKIKTPTELIVKYKDKSLKQHMPTNMLLDYGKYECNFKWDDIVNIGEYNSSVKHGYIITHNYISGEAYTRFSNIDVKKIRNTHYNLTSGSLLITSLRKKADEESVVWSTTHEDKHTDTGGDTIENTNYTIDVYSPTSSLTRVASIMSKWIANEVGNTNGIAWYYEDNNGNIEACSGYNTHVNNAGNPTIADKDISKAFLGAIVAIDKIKEGYEDYFN